MRTLFSAHARKRWFVRLGVFVASLRSSDDVCSSVADLGEAEESLVAAVATAMASLAAMVGQAAYNGYLAERRVELADGTWKISEDGIQVEIPGAKNTFSVWALCLGGFRHCLRSGELLTCRSSPYRSLGGMALE